MDWQRFDKEAREILIDINRQLSLVEDKRQDVFDGDDTAMDLKSSQKFLSSLKYSVQELQEIVNPK